MQSDVYSMLTLAYIKLSEMLHIQWHLSDLCLGVYNCQETAAYFSLHYI